MALYTLSLLEAYVGAAVECPSFAGGVVGYRFELALALAMNLTGRHTFLYHVVT